MQNKNHDLPASRGKRFIKYLVIKALNSPEFFELLPPLLFAGGD